MKFNVEVDLTQNEVQQLISGVEVTRLQTRVNEEIRQQISSDTRGDNDESESAWHASFNVNNQPQLIGGLESIERYRQALEEFENNQHYRRR